MNGSIIASIGRVGQSQDSPKAVSLVLAWDYLGTALFWLIYSGKMRFWYFGTLKMTGIPFAVFSRVAVGGGGKNC